MDSFSKATQEALGFYVYCLVDPRDNRIFYIGKGKGNRVFHHLSEALVSTKENLKLNIIRDIRKAGLCTKHYVIRHNLTEDEAYLLESTLIDLLSFGDFNTEHVLANIAAGHHQWDEGIKTAEELEILYNCAPITLSAKNRILLVSLNKSFNQAKASGVYRRMDLYDVTRRYWRISPSKAPLVKYVLGVYRGIVRSVVEVESFQWSDKAEDGTVFTRPRCSFKGTMLNDSPYLNKDVSAYPFGSGGAVRYI